jgi:hypothetical protein
MGTAHYSDGCPRVAAWKIKITTLGAVMDYDDECQCENRRNTTDKYAENFGMLCENAYRHGAFEHALVALKNGCKVSRVLWGGDYLVITNGLIMRYDAAAALIGNYLRHATATDLLATDWRVVT